MKPQDFDTHIFSLFDRHWALVTAGTPEKFNSMTISWSSMGTIWGAPGKGRPIVTVYINPLRYTYGIINKCDRYTVSFYPESFRKALTILGSRSGRDGDKLPGTGLTPLTVDGAVTYREAELTFVCRKLFQQTLDKRLIPPEIAEAFYAPEDDAHRMYIGEVEKIIEGPLK